MSILVHFQKPLAMIWNIHLIKPILALRLEAIVVASFFWPIIDHCINDLTVL